MKTFTGFLRSNKGAVALVILIAVLALWLPEVLLGLPVVAMANQKDRERFAVKGGGIAKIKEVASGGAFTTMDFIGYTEETDILIDQDMVEFKDERGFLINLVSSGEMWKVTIQLLQVGIDEINLLKTAANKYFHFYYQAQLRNGNYQEVYIPLCKIMPKVPLNFKPGKRSIPVEIVALMPKGAITSSPADYNVPADAYGVIIENAAAKGEIVTNTGTLYTAAF
jgi:hypothetical protein